MNLRGKLLGKQRTNNLMAILVADVPVSQIRKFALDVNLSQGTTLPHVHRLCAVVAEFGSKQNCE